MKMESISDPVIVWGIREIGKNVPLTNINDLSVFKNEMETKIKNLNEMEYLKGIDKFELVKITVTTEKTTVEDIEENGHLLYMINILKQRIKYGYKYKI